MKSHLLCTVQPLRSQSNWDPEFGGLMLYLHVTTIQESLCFLLNGVFKLFKIDPRVSSCWRPRQYHPLCYLERGSPGRYLWSSACTIWLLHGSMKSTQCHVWQCGSGHLTITLTEPLTGWTQIPRDYVDVIQINHCPFQRKDLGVSDFCKGCICVHVNRNEQKCSYIYNSHSLTTYQQVVTLLQ